MGDTKIDDKLLISVFTSLPMSDLVLIAKLLRFYGIEPYTKSALLRSAIRLLAGIAESNPNVVNIPTESLPDKLFETALRDKRRLEDRQRLDEAATAIAKGNDASMNEYMLSVLGRDVDTLNYTDDVSVDDLLDGLDPETLRKLEQL